jgi:nucleotidyltransferase AbiEii toxin of type IV toxin-antitoxin system
MKGRPRNLPASVRQRLMNLARKHGEDFQLVLTRFVIERFLYRLSRSPYHEEFILKGALLFRLWTDQFHRPTRDVDLLGKGDHSVERLTSVFQDVCAVAVPDDGLIFDAGTVAAERTKEDQEYEGVRVKCQVRLGTAQIQLQVDVGFGEPIATAQNAISRRISPAEEPPVQGISCNEPSSGIEPAKTPRPENMSQDINLHGVVKKLATA